MKGLAVVLIVLVSLTACQSAGRYHVKQDSKPKFDYGEIDLSDATPIYEPYREINSRPYTVLGQHYRPMMDGKGFVQTGQASWYGQKFHGHTTSNGEVYDMFEMTAAHKRLPLPSYVKVTNLDNNKTAVVRVNDRGPFHPGRVIDLSYAAAKKLDVLKTGVANVIVEVIHIDESGMKTVGLGPTIRPDVPQTIAAPAPPKVASNQMPVDDQTTTDIAIKSMVPPSIAQDLIYIQIAAISNQQSVAELSKTLSQMYQVDVDAPLINDLYRVRLGPIKTEQKAELLIQALKQNGFENAFQIVIPAT